MERVSILPNLQIMIVGATRMLSRHNLNQRGDTIIEVLLAMVVVGMTLGLGFNIVQRAQQAGQLARERSHALSMAESQLELLKANLKTPPVDSAYKSATDYCILSTGLVKSDLSSCTNISNINGGSSGFYTLRMRYQSSDTSYLSSVEWSPPNGDVEPARVELRYRTYD